MSEQTDQIDPSERHSFEVGERVLDIERLETTPSYAIVVRRTHLAVEDVTLDGTPLSHYNPEYNIRDRVVDVAFVSDIGRQVDGWGELEGEELAARVCDEMEDDLYAYPEGRLIAVERGHCRLCGRFGYCTSAMITDDGGGSFLGACPRCVGHALEADTAEGECDGCGNRKAPGAKADALIFSDLPNEDVDICDRCRTDALNHDAPWAEVVR